MSLISHAVCFSYEDNPEADKENTEDKNKEETKTEDKKDK